MEIKFLRRIRECAHNHAIENGRTAGRMIYDFDVLVNGESRAIMVHHNGREYALYDPHRQPIHYPHGYVSSIHIGERTSLPRKEWEVFILQGLENGSIPTYEQLNELRIERNKIRIAKNKAIRASRVAFKKKQYAAALYDMVQHVVNNNGKMSSSVFTVLRTQFESIKRECVAVEIQPVTEHDIVSLPSNWEEYLQR